MAVRKSSRVNRKYKTKYRIRNWREYERGLRSRGDVTIWLSEQAIVAWTPPKNGLRGGQRRYSNLAISTALTLRVVFRLPLRQTEGFLDSLLRLMGLGLKAPDLCMALLHDSTTVRFGPPWNRVRGDTSTVWFRRESVVWSGALRSRFIKLSSESRKPSVWRSGRRKRTRSVYWSSEFDVGAV